MDEELQECVKTSQKALFFGIGLLLLGLFAGIIGMFFYKNLSVMIIAAIIILAAINCFLPAFLTTATKSPFANDTDK